MVLKHLLSHVCEGLVGQEDDDILYTPTFGRYANCSGSRKAVSRVLRWSWHVTFVYVYGVISVVCILLHVALQPHTVTKTVLRDCMESAASLHLLFFLTNTWASPGDTTRQRQSSPIIELTTYCYIVLQKQLSSVSWHKAMHIHMQALSHSIKVVMAVLCCEKDCISIGRILWVHRPVLCMLMQTLKTDLGFRGGPRSN